MRKFYRRQLIYPIVYNNICSNSNVWLFSLVQFFKEIIEHAIKDTVKGLVAILSHPLNQICTNIRSPSQLNPHRMQMQSPQIVP